jgi:predicted HicB family RNase H-like nuclease
MANNRKRSVAPNRTLTDQLNVRMPTELFRRVGVVAGARGETITKFVSDTLNDRTKDHTLDVKKIVEREKLPKKWRWS